MVRARSRTGTPRSVPGVTELRMGPQVPGHQGTHPGSRPRRAETTSGRRTSSEACRHCLSSLPSSVVPATCALGTQPSQVLTDVGDVDHDISGIGSHVERDVHEQSKAEARSPCPCTSRRRRRRGGARWVRRRLRRLRWLRRLIRRTLRRRRGSGSHRPSGGVSSKYAGWVRACIRRDKRRRWY